MIFLRGLEFKRNLRSINRGLTISSTHRVREKSSPSDERLEASTGPPRFPSRPVVSPLLPTSRTSAVGIDPLSFVPQQYSDNGLLSDFVLVEKASVLSVAKYFDPCRLARQFKLDKQTLDLDKEIIFNKSNWISISY
jgi:hypothetical protein